MKVEIWSDIMCPFCYIGKRNFEQAISKFADKDQIEVEWKSFLLDPSIPENPDQQGDIYKYVADRKGLSYEHSRRMHDDVTQMAKDAGLAYNFDKVLITNSLKSHKLIQFAKTKGLGDAAEERLFLAYFTQGKNLNDTAVLTELGIEIGLTAAEVNEAMTNPGYAQQVTVEVNEAQALGIRGVPFFVIDRKYGVSGAQKPDVMLGAIEQAYAEWKKNNDGLLDIQAGAVCTPDGDCN
ncbi:DsbA family oxidoreductase [Chitinophaga sp.]|uniref:DsbA family oxidoreductase n=1 Tax=Chitinophaga sp. TaxID=1869181 RepID=UPI0031DA4BD9